MSKINKFCIKWLNENYNYMEPFIMKEYPDYIFHMKDGKCILQYNKKNGYVYVSYRKIWRFFESYFCMSNQQIKDITKIWVEEHYKMGVTTTIGLRLPLTKQVEEHYKMGVTTTTKSILVGFTPVEEHYKIRATTTCAAFIDNLLQVEEHYKMGVTRTLNGINLHWSMVEEQYKEILTTNNQSNFYIEKDVESLYERNNNKTHK
jgi:hypothetical protein